MIIEIGTNLKKRIKNEKNNYEIKFLESMKNGEDFEKMLLSFYMPPLITAFDT